MIRVGIVGCGRILAAHLRGYRLLREAGYDGFRVTALCSRDRRDAEMYVRRGEGPPQRAAVSNIAGDPLAIANEYLSDFQGDVPVEIHTDFRRMIAEAPLDAVNDFSTHALHHQVAEAAFANGKHLLTQKPLAASVAAARAMCRDAESRGLTFAVFENFRHAPSTRRLKWLFESESGPLGALQAILLGYYGAWWAPDRIVAETPWRHRLNEAGGISLDLGVHFFDQIRAVAGEIREVSAQTAVFSPERVTLGPDGTPVARIECDADDTFMSHARTERGILIDMFASWSGAGAATLVGEGTVFHAAHGTVSGDRISLPGGKAASLADWYRQGADPARQAREFPLGIEDSFALSQLDWLEAIANRRQPETDGWEGTRDLAAAFAILESAQAGRRVEVERVFSGEIREFQRPIDERFGFAATS